MAVFEASLRRLAKVLLTIIPRRMREARMIRKLTVSWPSVKGPICRDTIDSNVNVFMGCSSGFSFGLATSGNEKAGAVKPCLDGYFN
jgi:hypothetical protein